MNKCTLRTKIAQHMAYFFSTCSFLFFVTTNENNHKTLYIACSHHTQHTYQTGWLLKSKISTFCPIQIKPYSQLQVSMTSLTKFFTLVLLHHPDLFFQSLIGCQAMVTVFPVLSLVTKTHGSL